MQSHQQFASRHRYATAAYPNCSDAVCQSLRLCPQLARPPHLHPLNDTRPHERGGAAWWRRQAGEHACEASVRRARAGVFGAVRAVHPRPNLVHHAAGALAFLSACVRVEQHLRRHRGESTQLLKRSRRAARVVPCSGVSTPPSMAFRIQKL